MSRDDLPAWAQSDAAHPERADEWRALMRQRDEAQSQCRSVLHQTGAMIGVEPGAAVRALIADRDACANERDVERDRADAAEAEAAKLRAEIAALRELLCASRDVLRVIRNEAREHAADGECAGPDGTPRRGACRECRNGRDASDACDAIASALAGSGGRS